MGSSQPFFHFLSFSFSQELPLYYKKEIVHAVIRATIPLAFKICSVFYNGDPLLGLWVGFVVSGWLSYANQESLFIYSQG
jgi:hypothetical protein